MSRKVQFNTPQRTAGGRVLNTATAEDTQKSPHNRNSDFEATIYEPDYYRFHEGEVPQIKLYYDHKDSGVPHGPPEAVGGWQFNLTDGYQTSYPTTWDASVKNHTRSPRSGPLNQDHAPRTAIFDVNELVVLTALDDLPHQKYRSYSIEETDPRRRNDFAGSDSTQVQFRLPERSLPDMQTPGTPQRDLLPQEYVPERGILKQNRMMDQDSVKPPVSYLEQNDAFPPQQEIRASKYAEFPAGHKLSTITKNPGTGEFIQRPELGASQDSNKTEPATTRQSQSDSYIGDAEAILSTGPRWRRVVENKPVPGSDTEPGDFSKLDKEFFIFYTTFKDPTFPHNLPRGIRWYNPPDKWESLDDGGMRCFPKPKTDFWQRTYFGKDESKDSGHFVYLPCTHNRILLETSFTLNPKKQNDQAGVMIRYDRRNWLRAGIEFIDGSFQLTCVVTIKGFSDWSIQELKGGRRSIEMRLFAIDGDVIVEHRTSLSDGWRVLRVTHIDVDNLKSKPSQPEPDETQPGKTHNMVGLYTCRPSEDDDLGAFVTFHFMSLRRCEHYEKTELPKLKAEDEADLWSQLLGSKGPEIRDAQYFPATQRPFIRTYEKV